MGLERATVKVWNGALSSVRRESAPGTVRVRENTSNGPAKSSTSTSSKIRMPTVLRTSLAIAAARLNQVFRHAQEVRRPLQQRLVHRLCTRVDEAERAVERR